MHSFEVGDVLFIRTVTYHLLGKVERVETRPGDWLKLINASWIANSGRFGETLSKGSLRETEYVGDVYVNMATATDVFPWRHPLPSESIQPNK